MRRLVFASLVLAAMCGMFVFLSCKRLSNRKQHIELRTGPRNLTPGLSEELTAMARRHPDAGFIWIVDRSGNSEEAKNLAGLMTKALDAGGWIVIPNDLKSTDTIHGLYCGYGAGQEEAATALISVLEQKGLSIKGFKRDDDPAAGRGGFLMLTIEVGLNP
jgi:hypothetical protein